MLLEQITIDENIFKRLNPFKRNPIIHRTSFKKLKEINSLKKVLKSHINAYISKVSKNPNNKAEYFDELGELLLNEISSTLSVLQDALTNVVIPQAIKEEIEDKTLIRNLNFLFKELNLVDDDMSLVDVEKILLHIYKKLKEHLDIKFPLDVEGDDIDPESEYEDYIQYLKKFLKYPTADIVKLSKINSDKIGNEYYDQVKEKNKSQFDKAWKEKYKQQWFDNTLLKDLNDDWSKNTDIKKSFENFKKEWLQTYITPETIKIGYDEYFTKWFNTMLKIKFEQLWSSKFRNIWINLFKAQNKNKRDELSYLKENINNIFRIK